MTNEIEKFLEHVVLPSDTLQGLSLFYKIPMRNLRQINRFSGNSLSMAPAKLKIPSNIPCDRDECCDGKKCTCRKSIQDDSTNEFKIYSLLADANNHQGNVRLTAKDVVIYLENCDWNLKNAKTKMSKEAKRAPLPLSPCQLKNDEKKSFGSVAPSHGNFNSNVMNSFPDKKSKQSRGQPDDGMIYDQGNHNGIKSRITIMDSDGFTISKTCFNNAVLQEFDTFFLPVELLKKEDSIVVEKAEIEMKDISLLDEKKE